MFTTKRKILRSRKQLFTKIYILVGLILFGAVIGYFLGNKLFVKNGYLSPISKLGLSITSSQEDGINLVEEQLTKQKIEVASLKYQDASYVVTLKNGGLVYLSPQKDLNAQISSLQVILSRLTMEGKLFTQLDLRFDKPVILLKN
ncbi:MAG TPA: hypothetical protein VF810_01135 [Patescibacteria group bacterium]